MWPSRFPTPLLSVTIQLISLASLSLSPGHCEEAQEEKKGGGAEELG